MAKSPKMTAGASSGLGRIQKGKAYGTAKGQPTKRPAPETVKMPTNKKG